MVISVVPVPVTKPLVTSMVSTVESSEDFLIVMLPLSTSTASLKVSTILASTATPVTPSEGVEEDRVSDQAELLPNISREENTNLMNVLLIINLMLAYITFILLSIKL